jgi:hypothetical protein
MNSPVLASKAAAPADYSVSRAYHHSLLIIRDRRETIQILPPGSTVCRTKLRDAIFRWC